MVLLNKFGKGKYVFIQLILLLIIVPLCSEFVGSYGDNVNCDDSEADLTDNGYICTECGYDGLWQNPGWPPNSLNYCCGDDSTDHYRWAQEAFGGGWDIAWLTGEDTSDDACCDASDDCVFNGVCTSKKYAETGTNPGGHDNIVTCWESDSGPPPPHGSWLDCDGDPSRCENTPGTGNGGCGLTDRWVVGGEVAAFGEYDTGTSTECCGDDAGESFNYEIIWNPPSTRVNDLADDACCNNGADCIYNHVCYADGTTHPLYSDTFCMGDSYNFWIDCDATAAELDEVCTTSLCGSKVWRTDWGSGERRCCGDDGGADDMHVGTGGTCYYCNNGVYGSASCASGTASCYDDGYLSGSTCYYNENCANTGYTSPTTCSTSSYCVGSTRYYSGTCSGTGCSFSSQDCNTLDTCTGGQATFRDYYCSSGTCPYTDRDRDGASAYCTTTAGSCDAQTWTTTPDACCGDDGASDDFCSGGYTACSDGGWYTNGDSNSYTCGCGSGYWNVGSGDCTGESCLTNCCEDDGGEEYLSRVAAASMDNGYVTDSGDDACCNLNNKCIDDGGCYASTSTSRDADSDGDNDYCSSGTWYDCNTNAQCPVSQYCSSNNCVAIETASITGVTPQTDYPLNSELGRMIITYSGSLPSGYEYNLEEVTPTSAQRYYGTSTTYTHSSLGDNIQYCYRARIQDAPSPSRYGSWSSTVCDVTYDRTGAIPSTLTTTPDNPNNRIDASWTLNEQYSSDFTTSAGWTPVGTVAYNINQGGRPTARIAGPAWQYMYSSTVFTGSQHIKVDFYTSATSGTPHIIAFEGSNYRFCVHYIGASNYFRMQRNLGGSYDYPFNFPLSVTKNAWYTVELDYDGSGTSIACVYPTGSQHDGSNCYSSSGYPASWSERIYSWSDVDYSYLSRFKGVTYGLYSSPTLSGTYSPVDGISDGFSTDTTGDYTEYVEDWSVTGGYLRDSTANSYAHIVHDDTVANDVLVEADVYGGDNDWMGLIFRYTSNSNFYTFTVRAETNLAQLRKNGQTLNTVGSKSMTINTAQWYHLKVKAEGDSIKCYVNNVLVIDAIDSSHSTGKAGLYSGANSGTNYWDDFEVTPLIASNSYQDTTATDNSAPNAPGIPTVAAASETSLQVSGWSAPSDNGDDYFHYLKSIDEQGNIDNRLIASDTFENGWYSGWGLWSDVGSTLSIDSTTAAEGTYSLRCNLGGGGLWNTQFHHAGNNVVTGENYLIKFYAKANAAGHTFPIYLHMNSNPYTTYAFTPNMAITTEWKEYTYAFSTVTGTDANTRFNILPKGNGVASQVWLDNIRLYKVESATVTTGVDNYQIDGDGGAGVSDSGWQGSPWTDSGLDCFSQYRYRVRAQDNVANAGSYGTYSGYVYPISYYACDEAGSGADGYCAHSGVCYYTGTGCPSGNCDSGSSSCFDDPYESSNSCYYDENCASGGYTAPTEGTTISGQSCSTCDSGSCSVDYCWEGTTCYYSISCGGTSGWTGSSGATACAASSSTCCTDTTTIWESVGCSAGGISGSSFDRDSSIGRCTSTASGCSAYTWLSSGIGTNSDCCGDDEDDDDFEQTSGSCCYDGAVLADSASSNSVLCSVGKLYDCGNQVSMTDNIDTDVADCYGLQSGLYCDTDTNTWINKIPTNCSGCTNGNECEENLCIETNCSSGCTGSEDGDRCSDDGNVYTDAASGICARNSASVWSCDKDEVSYYSADHYTDCDQSAGNGEICDSDVAPSFSQNGQCAGGSCCTDEVVTNSECDCDDDDVTSEKQCDNSVISGVYSADGICANDGSGTGDGDANCNISGEICIDSGNGDRYTMGCDSCLDIDHCDSSLTSANYVQDGICAQNSCDTDEVAKDCSYAEADCSNYYNDCSSVNNNDRCYTGGTSYSDNGICSGGSCVSLTGSETLGVNCNDDIDNDGDGYIDYDDNDCCPVIDGNDITIYSSTGSGENCLKIDTDGDVAVAQIFSNGSISSVLSDSFIINNSAGNVVAYVNDSCHMRITGTVNDNYGGTITDSGNNNFLVKVKDGEYVFKIDSNGNLYSKGQLGGRTCTI